ncbi:saccharopine dehydrogenase related protein [Lactobacillus sp. 0.1XD8-4]|uniref:Saccharopine dehydrogenase related protein n=1 Tax=Limosilactobacillus walteri TaxID=2268022 RepID=A0ABR8P8Q6_9LACO|nr:NAD(P)H-binding protein [Limosilactobacillus walteri]MBD5807135.1 saccharopine dehydrogenase related protein [Limosilactobacillus walteri]MRN07339.1 saccharopine dehydrogenase related protein [Lactobacillus sp. 0.1XD8-4]
MSRIVFVSRRYDKLVSLLMEKVPDAVATTNFKIDLQNGDVLCWLPTVMEFVDDEVQELAELIDHSLFPPTKIVMLSIAGTADDATVDQLQAWYGKQARQAVFAHQYAIKMIDELELPYTIIRTLPISNSETNVEIINEGHPLSGQRIGLKQVAQVIERAVTTDDFRNQSIGIAPLESE